MFFEFIDNIDVFLTFLSTLTLLKKLAPVVKWKEEDEDKTGANVIKLFKL